MERDKNGVQQGDCVKSSTHSRGRPRNPRPNRKMLYHFRRDSREAKLSVQGLPCDVRMCMRPVLQTIRSLLSQNSVLRLPLDVDEPNALISQYLTETLQSLAKRAKFSRRQIKEISCMVLEAIAEIHDIAYLHGGMCHSYLGGSNRSRAC